MQYCIFPLRHKQRIAIQMAKQEAKKQLEFTEWCHSRLKVNPRDRSKALKKSCIINSQQQKRQYCVIKHGHQ
jgi:hypothetical protein